MSTSHVSEGRAEHGKRRETAEWRATEGTPPGGLGMSLLLENLSIFHVTFPAGPGKWECILAPASDQGLIISDALC